MKSILLCLLLSLSAFSQQTSYNESLAVKLGADDYGMRQYVLVILKTGPAKPADAERQKLMAGHMENIGRMADEGTLVMAGPFLKNDFAYRGLYIFAVKTVDEARALTETDPAVKAGVLEADYLPWYGSAALPELTAIHKTIQKQKI